MSWTSWLVWGFAATAVLTTVMAGSEGLGITRMNIPHMLGTMFTANRDRAKVYGAALHFLNGWAFSIVYVAGFHAAHRFTWWFGMFLGLIHGLFVAAVVLPVMPGVHPRMASALRGPTVARQLEPPGFLALNYGARTPISVLIAHMVFGAILGGFYTPASDGQRRTCSSAVPSYDGMQVPPYYSSDEEAADTVAPSRSWRNSRACSSASAGTSTAISTMCSATPTSVVAGPRKRAAIPS
jgi:hypothetical protein